MTALIVLETILLALLTVLVAGLLRAYGTVLRRLHELDGGGSGPRQFELDRPASVTPPTPREQWSEGHDVAGETVGGELVTTRVVGVEHDTVVLFLSSGCVSCETFWDELSQPARLPSGTRLVVITQGEDAESRDAVATLAPSGLDVIMSTPAWRDYEVPGSPHVVFVEGRTGRIRGEGTGQSWRQVTQMLARATGDTTFLDGPPAPTDQHARPHQRSGALQQPGAKPARDAEVEAAVDRELMAAGILPGDPRLYGSDA